MDLAPITFWLTTALNRHVALPKNEPARTEAVAAQDDAIVDAETVAFDPEEAPIAIPGFPSSRPMTALLLIAIELHETGLRARYRRGECRPHECDDGNATGEFQLHLGKGLRLLGDRRWEPCSSGDDCITPARAIEDHASAARVALHMLRAGGLPGYTGQPWDGPAPRWIRAVMASAEAPPDPPKE